MCSSDLATQSPTPPSVRYELLGLGDLWLSFAGRAARHDEACDAIVRLVTGDALRLRPGEKRLSLEDPSGHQVGALSEAASNLWRDRLHQILSVRIAAIVIRHRDDENSEYQDALGRDAWPVVIPEVKWSGQQAHG